MNEKISPKGKLSSKEDFKLKDFFDKVKDKIKNKDKIALSRCLSFIENEDHRILPLIKDINTETGKSYRIGITGPPGVGKSTLINNLAKEIRKQNKTLGIIAIDPTSPFTGGALLGDRIRMSKALTDEGIFMRSMASRGGTGGLAKTTHLTMDLMDAYGFDIIILETVGVGQLELDVTNLVDTTIVVLVPETSGNVQALKAGLIEIADIFVVNKSDRRGADTLKYELMESIDMKKENITNSWKIPILKTCSIEQKGIEQLFDTIYKHYSYLNEFNLLKVNREKQKKNRITNIIKHFLERVLLENNKTLPLLEKLSRDCACGKIDPYSAAENFISKTCIIDKNKINFYNI